MTQDHLGLITHLLLNQQPEAGILEQLQGISLADWQELQSTATHHLLMPTLYLRFKTLEGALSIPEDFKHHLRTAILKNSARNMYFLHEAGQVLDALNEADIPTIALKGIYLIENIYQDVGTRYLSDLDLMIKKGDIPAALEICQSLGYTPTTYFDNTDPNLDIKHVPPLKKVDGPYLELHWTILEEGEPFTIDASGLWQRAIKTKISGVEAFTLSPEDLLLHLCLHLTYQHHLSLGLRGLYDIVKVLQHFEGQLDWQGISEIAQGWGAERVLRLTLSLVREVFNFKLPPQAMNDVQQYPFKPWVLEQAYKQLLGQNQDLLPMTPDLAEFAKEKSSFSGIRRVWRRVFLPKSTLAREYGVPPTSIRIYWCYIRRLTNLIQRYSRSVFRMWFRKQDALAGVADEQNIGRLRKWMIEN
jgi:hypothetical protein